MKHLTAQDFKENIFDYTKSNEWKYEGKPIIIDFYADWCGPCKALSPILEEFSKNNPNIEVFKVNIEKEYELSNIFQIRSIPSILFIPNKKEPSMVNGLLTLSDLEKISKNLF